MTNKDLSGLRSHFLSVGLRKSHIISTEKMHTGEYCAQYAESRIWRHTASNSVKHVTASRRYASSVADTAAWCVEMRQVCSGWISGPKTGCGLQNCVTKLEGFAACISQGDLRSLDSPYQAVTIISRDCENYWIDMLFWLQSFEGWIALSAG